MATFSALIVNTGEGRSTQTAIQTSADAASQAAAKTWLTTEDWAPGLTAHDQTSSGVVGAAVAMASANGEAASLINKCTVQNNSSQYDVIFYDSGSSCSNTAWNFSVEVQIPPVTIPSTLTTTCNPTYMCIDVIAKQHRLGNTVGSVLGVAPTVTSSSISYAGATASAASAAWATVPTQNAASGSGNLFNSTSCVSTSFCMAVGWYTNASSIKQTLAEQWGPSGCTTTCAWGSIVYPPNQGADSNKLYSVDCLTTSFCVAAGYYYDSSGDQQNLVEEYNGTSWTAVTPPNEPSSTNNWMWAVTCVTTMDCWMVGTYELGSSQWQTLTENCTVCSGASPNWTIVASPSHDPTLTSQLYSVTCVASNNCWAAGTYTEDVNYLGGPERGYCGTSISTSICRNYVEHWDGTSWSDASTIPALTTPNQDGGTPYADQLSAVTCLSATDCRLLGQYFDSNDVSQPFAISWNGTAWDATVTLLPTQSSGGAHDTWPNSEACITASNCWVVGQYATVVGCNMWSSPACTYKTLIDHYNGTSWSMDSTDSGQDSALNSVACHPPPATECWAVGNGGAGGNSTLGKLYSSSGPSSTGDVSLVG